MNLGTLYKPEEFHICTYNRVPNVMLLSRPHGPLDECAKFLKSATIQAHVSPLPVLWCLAGGHLCAVRGNLRKLKV